MTILALALLIFAIGVVFVGLVAALMLAISVVTALGALVWGFIEGLIEEVRKQ